MNIGPNLLGFELLLKRTVRILETLPQELQRISCAMELQNELLAELLNQRNSR